MTQKTLYVSISGHGYGHIGQMAPILNKLAMEYGQQLQFVIQCEAQESFLTNCFQFDFRHIPKAADIGMLMSNSLDVQPQQSHRAYREMHDRWGRELLLKSRGIDRLRPDLILSNVSYLTLAAAHKLQIPAIALCSLNWADIYFQCCGSLPGSDEVRELALEHYRSADHFLIPTPGMPMTDLPNRRHIGPLARLANRYPHFRSRLKLNDNTRLVMVSMGGIPYQLASAQWPVLDNVVWIDTSNSCQNRADIIPMNRLNLPFIDVLGHCDLLICKPGYGLFTEATCNGVPVLYVKRGLWPEEPYLVDWIEQNNLCAELDRQQFNRGDLAGPVTELLNSAREQKPKPVMPAGVGEACGYVLEALELV